MTETARLVLAVDSTQARKATDELDKLTRQGSQTESRLGRSLKNVGGFFAGAAAGVAGFVSVGALISGVIQNTIEAEKVSAQLDATLKSTGRYTPELSAAIKAYSSELQGVTTFGDEAITASQALLLTFTKIGGESFPRAQKAILDVATAMGTDLKSATIQVGKALNDPVQGITALTRSGIQFTDEQKNLIKALVDTGQEAKAQEVILAELETQFGGSAVAARNTLGGAIASLKNSFGDLLEGSGGNLNGVTTAINELTETLNDPSVKDGFGEVVSGILSITKVAVEGIGAIGGLISELRDLGKEADQKGYENLLKQRLRVSEQINTAENTTAGRAGVVVRNLFGLPTVDELKAELDKIDAEINKRLRNNPNTPSSGAVIAETLGTSPTGTEDGGGGGGGGGNSAAARELADLQRQREQAARDLEKSAEAEARATDSFRRSAEDLRAELGGPLAEATLRYERELAALRETYAAAAIPAAELALAEADLAEKFRLTTDEIERQQNPQRELIDALREELDLVGLSNEERQKRILLQQAGVNATAEERQAISDLVDEIKLQNDNVRTFDNIRGASDDFFLSVIDGSKSAKDALKDFASSVQQIISQRIAESFTNSLFGESGTTGGGVFGGFLNNLLGGFFGGKRMGGDVNRSGSYMVGEDGPERVFLPRGSSVQRGSRGNPTQVINISVEGQVKMSTRKQIAAEAGRASQKALVRGF